MMMKHICMVKGIRLQKPSPKALVVAVGEAPAAMATSATNTTATVAVGSYPGAVAVNPSTNRIYVANSGVVVQNSPQGVSVSVIDGASDAIISTVALGRFVRGERGRARKRAMSVRALEDLAQWAVAPSTVPSDAALVDGRERIGLLGRHAEALQAAFDFALPFLKRGARGGAERVGLG